MRILFISHDASRTGAPMLLKHLLVWIRDNRPELKIDVLILQEGALDTDFKTLSDGYFNFSDYEKSKKNIFDTIYRKISKQLIKYNFDIHSHTTESLKEVQLSQFLIHIAHQNQYDIIYANTALTIQSALKIKNNSLLKPKVFANIHELDVVLKLYTPDIYKYINEVDTIIAGSKLVKDNLIDNYSVNPKLVEVIYDFTDYNELKVADETYRKKDKCFCVGGMGALQWRKGDDLFIQIARFVKSHYSEPNIKFIWVGALSSFNRVTIENELRKAGLSDSVEFVGESVDYYKYYREFDLFLLPSREDPFPLVAIEAGLNGLPIICFENSTGISEVITKGGGFVVPYLDIESMAEKIMVYYSNNTKLKMDGELNRIQFLNYTSERICPQLLNLMLNN